VIHHIVFELGKTRGGAGLVFAYVHRCESFGTTQQAVIETAEEVALAKQQQVFCCNNSILTLGLTIYFEPSNFKAKAGMLSVSV
jgi:hypothetical protein